jgi:hypothetical protein
MKPDLQEVNALLEYMVHHNTDHAQELKVLSEKVKTLGKTAAYQQLSSGIQKMQEANRHFEEALNELQKEK